MNPEQQTATGITDPTVLQAIQQLANTASFNVPVPTIPTIQFQAPTVSDISSQYNTFLQRAAKDPDIINYYNKILQQAGQDTQLAEQYLEADYQTGLRKTVQDLQGTLQQLGLQWQSDNQSQQDALNKRGIALTQGADGKLTYGGGGEAATEIGQTQQSQQLRKEAEQRTAQQNITALQSTKQKGMSQAGSQLAQAGLDAQQKMSSDVLSRASTYMDLYTSEQAAKAKQASDQQQREANAGPKPDMPQPGTAPYHVDQRINGWRWNGVNWEVVQ